MSRPLQRQARSLPRALEQYMKNSAEAFRGMLTFGPLRGRILVCPNYQHPPNTFLSHPLKLSPFPRLGFVSLWLDAKWALSLPHTANLAGPPLFCFACCLAVIVTLRLSLF